MHNASPDVCTLLCYLGCTVQCSLALHCPALLQYTLCFRICRNSIFWNCYISVLIHNEILKANNGIAVPRNIMMYLLSLGYFKISICISLMLLKTPMNGLTDRITLNFFHCVPRQVVVIVILWLRIVIWIHVFAIAASSSSARRAAGAEGVGLQMCKLEPTDLLCVKNNNN